MSALILDLRPGGRMLRSEFRLASCTVLPAVSVSRTLPSRTDDVADPLQIAHVHARALFRGRRHLSHVDGHPRLVEHGSIEGQGAAQQAGVAWHGGDVVDVHGGSAVIAAIAETGDLDSAKPADRQIADIRLAPRAAVDLGLDPMRESLGGENHGDQKHDHEQKNQYANQHPRPFAWPRRPFGFGCVYLALLLCFHRFTSESVP